MDCYTNLDINVRLDGSSPLRSSAPVNMDTDPAFIKLVDAAWEAILQFNNNKDDANTQTVMQTVNALNAYFKANGAPDPKNPTDALALAVYNAMGTGTFSLSGACASYGTSSCPSAVQAFESGQISFGPLLNALNAFGSSYSDQKNTTIQSDLEILQGALQTYNDYMSQKYKDPSELNDLLTHIALDINQLKKDASTANLSDGYLTVINTFLNTPISATGTATLNSLASVFSSGTTPTAAQLTALQNGLTALGEGSSSSGGDLQSFLLFTLKQEYGG